MNRVEFWQSQNSTNQKDLVGLLDPVGGRESCFELFYICSIVACEEDLLLLSMAAETIAITANTEK